MICPVCGNRVAEGTKSCPICKTALAERLEIVACPMCGTIVDPFSTVCPSCGAEFAQEREEHEEPAPGKREETIARAMKDMDALVEEDIQDLVKVPGIGPLKARALYEAGYTDLRKLKAATVKELMMVRGIGRRGAALIKRAVHISDLDRLREAVLTEADVEAEQACPICGTILSIYESSCFECGKELGTRAVEGAEENALTHYDHMLEIDPENTEMWYARGSTLARIGRDEEAIQSFERAVEMDPRYDAAWIAMAGIYTKMGDGRRAADCYRHVISAAGVIDLLPKTEPPAPSEPTPEDSRMLDRELGLAGPSCQICGSSLDAEGNCPVCDMKPEGEITGAEAQAPSPPEPEAEKIEPKRTVPGDIDSMSEKELYGLLSNIATEIKPLLRLAKELEIDMSEGKRLISEAVIYGKKKEPKKATQLILQAQKMVQNAFKGRLLREVSTIENDAEELRLAGVSVTRAMTHLKEAKRALREGRFSAVVSEIGDARVDIEALKKAMGGHAA
ncbi:MAG: zinc ribbon domain-containing protein [Candidatus Thermoplasmatota archaeon]